MEIDRIFDQWLIQITDIAGEDDFFLFAIFDTPIFPDQI